MPSFNLGYKGKVQFMRWSQIDSFALVLMEQAK